MKYRYLGRSGLLVSRLCLGTMTFGNSQWGCDQETSSAIVKRFVEGGGNFIDTANGYSGGASETMLGVALKDFSRDQLVIATKCWFPADPAVTSRGLNRKHIVEACEKSLKRLDTDYIDLYQFHGPDPYTPIEESLRAADDLIRAGKIRYLGCSNFYGWQIAKTNGVAALKGYEPLVSAQHLYNLVRRDIEREILPACDDQGLGMICWSPLAAGMLTGKYRGEDKPDEKSRIGQQAAITLPRYWFEDSLKMIDKVVEVAGRLGRTPSQVALSWLLGDHEGYRRHHRRPPRRPGRREPRRRRFRPAGRGAPGTHRRHAAEARLPLRVDEHQPAGHLRQGGAGAAPHAAAAVTPSRGADVAIACLAGEVCPKRA
jgi:aryl-alcohol dehydrogenase-like predicted oxidoreductase